MGTRCPCPSPAAPPPSGARCAVARPSRCAGQPSGTAACAKRSSRSTTSRAAARAPRWGLCAPPPA
eukprot:5329965-Alexandrium_andersonii.AAC.1